ncbi:hypothetical protein L1D32_01160 [Shewanella insulae]|uniref:hypothetical protein n=1 Tax=Shewanella insulae TaxID=2681496 RepID=UPI001EFD3861|nr:hypothetical protein [Shewanella insulae]MCG9736768.1 hypothetical protein [Shewanella insulae]
MEAAPTELEALFEEGKEAEEDEEDVEIEADENGNALWRIAARDGVVMAPAMALHLDVYHCT